MKTMKISRDSRGIAHLVLILLIMAVAATIAFVGYRVSNGSGSKNDSVASKSSQTAVPDKIRTESDLRQADKALDTMPIDNGVNPDSLDSDLDAIR